MSEHEQTADILDGAADVIERDGWFKLGPDHMREGNRSACALVAIQRAASEAGDLALSLLPVKVLERRVGVFITIWNDTPERTRQEVLDALRGAAEDQRRLADGIEA